MKYLYVLLAFSFLFSCKDENKKQAESILKEWMNKEIVFPKKMYFSIQGKENVDFRIKDTEYKIVAYVDSAGCTSCKLHLSKWKELIHYMDSVQPERVQFLFFFFLRMVEIYIILCGWINLLIRFALILLIISTN